MNHSLCTRGLTAGAALATLAVGPTVSAQCVSNVPAGFNGQIGIQGQFVQECGDGQWVGLAFPFLTGGGLRDTVRFSLNTNRAGGDVYVMGNTNAGGSCNPDTLNILASWCCGLEGLATNVQPATHNLHDLVAPAAFATSAVDPTWVVFVVRSGAAGQNAQGIPNGANFPGHQVARDTTQPSTANHSFANVVGTGNPGDWVDLITLGATLGTPYDVALLDTPGAPDPADNCANAPVGACCTDAPGCEILRPFECGMAGGIYNGNGSNCAAPALFSCTCGEGAGNCLVGHGTPGCNSMLCCKQICIADPFCCDTEWDDNCASDALLPANISACLPNLEPPTGVMLSNRNVEGNGRARTSGDAFGSWASAGFGGLGDGFNPGPPAAAGGDPGPQEVAFSTGTFVFMDLDNNGTNEARELLSSLAQYEAATADDNTLVTQVLDGVIGNTSDTNGNGAVDTATSSFRLITPSLAVDLNFGVFQSVVDGGSPDSAVYTLTYTISNNTATAVTMKLVRHVDADMLFDPGVDFANDSVGTESNGGGDWGVFQQEFASPNTRIHLTNATSEVYVGSKGGIDPDPGDPTCVNYGFGTDTIFWNAFGITDGDGTTDCWANNIAYLGDLTDGESGTGTGDPACNPCDGMILLEDSVTVPAGPGPGVIVTYRYTYGVPTAPCPWDCQDTPDGNVGINDLLDLLSQWGGAGPCDFDGGGVGINDLLDLLAEWGPCN